MRDVLLGKKSLGEAVAFDKVGELPREPLVIREIPGK
jgi:hypothetical protein